MNTDESSSLAQADLDALLRLSEAIVEGREVVDQLALLAEGLGERLGADECSVVLVDRPEQLAWVVAAWPAPDEPQRPLEPERHPEIVAVVTRRAPLVVASIDDPLFDGVRTLLADQPWRSMILFPVRTGPEVDAVLRLRAKSARGSGLTERELRLGRLFANVTGMILRNARLLQTIKSRYRDRRSEVLTMERQLRHVEKYRRFFDFAGDGQLIVDLRGRILFANRASEVVLGLEVAALHQMRLSDLVADHGHDMLAEVLAALTRGEYGRWDLPVVHADGRLRTLALTTAPLSPQEGAQARAEPSIIISFRDVTETRSIEADLRRTQEFLTSLIESSADAIVATDIRGRIVLFNDAACRITGYSWAEAHGMLAEALYPPGVARRIMAELRGAKHGSAGKLSERRATIVAKDGGLVPVSLSLGIVYAPSGDETAVVGIFADLRPQLRLEDELSSAQAKASLSERQRTALEVAGAAAHALNQPLTAIMGTIELMTRRQPKDAESQEDLRRLLEEVERMAAIVDKIGRVTRYETEPYIEGRAILDLDRSSE